MEKQKNYGRLSVVKPELRKLRIEILDDDDGVSVGDFFFEARRDVEDEEGWKIASEGLREEILRCARLPWK